MIDDLTYDLVFTSFHLDLVNSETFFFFLSQISQIKRHFGMLFPYLVIVILLFQTS